MARKQSTPFNPPSEPPFASPAFHTVQFLNGFEALEPLQKSPQKKNRVEGHKPMRFIMAKARQKRKIEGISKDFPFRRIRTWVVSATGTY